jgi:hypothetical protein
LGNRICHAGAIEEVYSIIFEEDFGPTPLQEDCTLDAGAPIRAADFVGAEREGVYYKALK